MPDTIRATRIFHSGGDKRANERSDCTRCGIPRQRRRLSPTGLCRDCKSVDPTFGQEVRDEQRSA